MSPGEKGSGCERKGQTIVRESLFTRCKRDCEKASQEDPFWIKSPNQKMLEGCKQKYITIEYVKAMIRVKLHWEKKNQGSNEWQEIYITTEQREKVGSF